MSEEASSVPPPPAALDPPSEPAQPTTPPDEATGTPGGGRSEERGDKLRRLLPLLFLVVTQPLLLVSILVPAWWAALPILSVWGIIGWRNRWIWAPLAGFLLGFGFWVFELLLLPAAPRDRLATVIAAGLGVSPLNALLIGPLLFGVLSAFGALTVAGALRVWDDVRGYERPAPGPRRLVPWKG